MAKSEKAMEELLKALNKITNERGLSIHQENTKYLEVNTNVNIRQHNFERMQTFSFLGSVTNDKNIKCEDILMRINEGNKAFFMNKKLLSSKLSEKKSKMKIHISIIRPIVTYAAENFDLDGVGHELFNDLQKKNPEEEFWSHSRKGQIEDQD